MTIQKIANQVCFFLSKERSYFVSGGDDMLIMAMNAVRKSLEQQHDFCNGQAKAWIAVDPDTGGALSGAKNVSGETLGATSVNVKSVDTVYLQDTASTDVWWPLWHDPIKLLANKAKERNYRYRGYPGTASTYADAPLTRYPGNTNDLSSYRPFRGYFQGRTFFIDPQFDVSRNCILDCQLWMDDYVANQVIVTLSATASPTVTVSTTVPSNFIVGTTFLGSTVTNISSTTITLAANANTLITSPTNVAYSNRDGLTPGASRESVEDWLCEHGHEYLKWATVCELNPKTLSFVPRANGFLAPPEKARDEALQRLVEWDVFMWESGRTPMAIR